MSEPKIAEVFKQFGVRISSGEVSNLLTKDTEPWQAEACAVLKAGLASTSWQNMAPRSRAARSRGRATLDDTPTRVDGDNYYCHILSNPLYTW